MPIALLLSNLNVSVMGFLNVQKFVAFWLQTIYGMKLKIIKLFI